jgi:hypothetical protein
MSLVLRGSKNPGFVKVTRILVSSKQFRITIYYRHVHTIDVTFDAVDIAIVQGQYQMLGYIFGGFTKKLKYSLKDTSKYFAEKNRQELSKLFDKKIFPFADKLDYIAKRRI